MKKLNRISTLILLFSIIAAIDAQPIQSFFDVSNLNGTNGFNMVFEGTAEINSIADAGDINGDGINDLIVTDPSEIPSGSGTNTGRVYIVFGSDNGYPSLLNLSELDGSNGFYINGSTEPILLGIDVDGLGDINGDGFDDFIISSSFINNQNNNPNDDFGAYVIFGKSSFPNILDPALLDGSDGFKIFTSPFPGASPNVNMAGDINGDGLNDILLGDQPTLAFPGTNLPKAYVIFGKTSFPSSIDALNLNGSDGFIFEGDIDFTGSEIAGGGDINNDGFDDVIIGSLETNYVIYGKNSSFNPLMTPTDINGNNGFVLDPPQATNFSSVSFLNDINGDGINDIALGISLADPNGLNDAGQAVVVFGQSNGFSSPFDFTTLDGSNGFIINGINADDKFGSDVANVDDFNGDGLSDLLVFADISSSLIPERSFLIYGSNGNFPLIIEASSLDGSNGFAFNSGLPTLGGTFGALDLNNDGLSDIACLTGVFVSSVIFGTNVNAPYFTNVIENQSTFENGNSIIIDLEGRVTDDDSDDSFITFQITNNSNSSLISTSITNNVLIIEPLQDQNGEGDLTLTATSDGLIVQNRFTVFVNEVPLYEQSGIFDTNNVQASQFFPDVNAALESADNFIISSGESWTINRVTVEGAFNGTAPEIGLVIIYDDNQGNVGNPIFSSQDIQLVSTINDGSYELLISNPPTLQTGTYWISVQAKKEFNPGQNQWFWGYFQPEINQDYYFQDSNQLLGATSPVVYSPSGNNGAHIFSLFGNSTGGSPNLAPTISDITFSIDENSTVSSVVGTIIASDPENSPITYSIAAGNSLGGFQIDENNGEISVADSVPLDFETNPTFILVVVANDGELSEFAFVTINLNDLDDDLSISANQESLIKVYPNPFKNKIKVDIPESVKIDKASILDIQGRLIYTIEDLNRLVNLEFLQSGTYILKIQYKSKNISYKIIKE